MYWHIRSFLIVFDEHEKTILISMIHSIGLLLLLNNYFLGQLSLMTNNSQGLSSRKTRSFYNCTLTWFDPSCSFAFDPLSDHSLDEIIIFIFQWKPIVYFGRQVICYEHLVDLFRLARKFVIEKSIVWMKLTKFIAGILRSINVKIMNIDAYFHFKDLIDNLNEFLEINHWFQIHHSNVEMFQYNEIMVNKLLMNKVDRIFIKISS